MEKRGGRGGKKGGEGEGEWGCEREKRERNGIHKYHTVRFISTPAH